MNELIFLAHTTLISLFTLGAFAWSREALTVFVACQTILANLFVTKTVLFFGYTATGADAFIIGSVFGFHILQEYYGKNHAKHVIWLSFALLISYTIMTQVHLAYLPCPQDFTHQSFVTLFTVMPRLTLASLLSYLVVSQCDYRLYAFLKRKCNNNYLVVRNIGCASITQLLDTILFSFLGLYGIVQNITQIIVISYCIKLVALLTTSPFLALTKRIHMRFLIKK